MKMQSNIYATISGKISKLLILTDSTLKPKTCSFRSFRDA